MFTRCVYNLVQKNSVPAVTDPRTFAETSPHFSTGLVTTPHLKPKKAKARNLQAVVGSLPDQPLESVNHDAEAAGFSLIRGEKICILQIWAPERFIYDLEVIR
ncbi:Macro domain-containing protein [Psidium guajava]|nr:Macro domain-containing protein [Psidium guajava]